jgi:3-oxoacyl-[acyl-carrier-protein] synthase II
MGDAVVITGCGAVTSMAASAAGTWAALNDGASGVRRLSHGETERLGCISAGLAVPVDAAALGVSARDARIMRLPGLMLLAGAREAMRQARLDPATYGPDEVGFYAGMGMVDPAADDLASAVAASRGEDGIDYARFFADGYREIYPLWPLAMLNNVGFCLAALHLGVRGDNAVFSPGADAALLALAEACAAVRTDRVAAALAAGVSEAASPHSIARAGLAGGWSDPASRCALGEAAAALVVETEAGARARGVAPLAAVVGWGFSSAPRPAQAFVAAMEQALERDGAAGRPVDTVVLHDERCGEVDRAERAAVRKVCAERAASPALVSSKRRLGDALAGGAAVDLALAVHALAGGALPAALRVGPRRRSVPAAPPRRIIVNARSWSGACGSVLLDAVE